MLLTPLQHQSPIQNSEVRIQSELSRTTSEPIICQRDTIQSPNPTGSNPSPCFLIVCLRRIADFFYWVFCCSKSIAHSTQSNSDEQIQTPPSEILSDGYVGFSSENFSLPPNSDEQIQTPPSVNLPANKSRADWIAMIFSETQMSQQMLKFMIASVRSKFTYDEESNILFMLGAESDGQWLYQNREILYSPDAKIIQRDVRYRRVAMKLGREDLLHLIDRTLISKEV